MSQAISVRNRRSVSVAAAKPMIDQNAAASPVGRALLDAGELLLLLAFYGWFLSQLASSFRENPSNWNCALLLASETMTVLFLVCRRRSATCSKSLGHWLLALAATLTPLLARPGGATIPPAAWLGQALLAAGTLSALFAKLSLGRSIGMVPANRGLRVSGPYRLIRHPIYASYIVCHLGVLLQYPTAWNLTVYAALYIMQMTRLFIEESHLARDPSYGAYMQTVPYRLMPGVF